jgi:hypothetical protein
MVDKPYCLDRKNLGNSGIVNGKKVVSIALFAALSQIR